MQLLHVVWKQEGVVLRLCLQENTISLQIKFPPSQNITQSFMTTTHPLLSLQQGRYNWCAQASLTGLQWTNTEGYVAMTTWGAQP